MSKKDRAAYAVMRRDVFNDGNSYDYDYPIESVFLTRDAAEWHVAALINDMRKTDEYDDYLDDELFDIVEVPLVEGVKRRNVAGHIVEPPNRDEWVNWGDKV